MKIKVAARKAVKMKKHVMNFVNDVRRKRLEIMSVVDQVDQVGVKHKRENVVVEVEKEVKKEEVVENVVEIMEMEIMEMEIKEKKVNVIIVEESKIVNVKDDK